MKIHFDHPWSRDVREDGAPVRLCITTKKWFYSLGARSQVWTPSEGWDTDRVSWFTRCPARRHS